MGNQQDKPNESTRPAQHQADQPGIESEMRPRPQSQARNYRAAGKLEGKVALITGGDSGIGRAVAITYAKEGCDVAIAYLDEHDDARETARLVEQEGRRCRTYAGDLGKEGICVELVERAVKDLGRLDILVNNAGEQHPQDCLTNISAQQLEQTFRTNVYSCFFVTKAALKYLKEGSSIINTASITAYRGHAQLIDYAATKGAIVAFTRSLAQQLVKQGIRVNGVAPGPIWTPLIPASFEAQDVKKFGGNVPMRRPGEPDEVAPCYVFLASDDASFMTGQMLHPNGGEVVNA